MLTFLLVICVFWCHLPIYSLTKMDRGGCSGIIVNSPRVNMIIQAFEKWDLLKDKQVTNPKQPQEKHKHEIITLILETCNHFKWLAYKISDINKTSIERHEKKKTGWETQHCLHDHMGLLPLLLRIAFLILSGLL